MTHHYYSKAYKFRPGVCFTLRYLQACKPIFLANFPSFLATAWQVYLWDTNGENLQNNISCISKCKIFCKFLVEVHPWILYKQVNGRYRLISRLEEFERHLAIFLRKMVQISDT